MWIDLRVSNKSLRGHFRDCQADTKYQIAVRGYKIDTVCKQTLQTVILW